MNRRDLLTSGMVAASAALTSFRSSAVQPSASSAYSPAFEPLDNFVEQFLRDMNAPGLTLALADSTGVQRVCTYGLNDLARHTPVNVEELFHIGSISKSFLAICLLQLHDEGKLDLHRPVERYLPWLRFDGLGRSLTAHDLLTHSAGLPDGPLFPTDPALRHRATTVPGAHFHYCNMGYAALGHLLAQLDGRPMEDCFRARILAPLGMAATEPTITLDAFDRMAMSYQVSLNDRPYPRGGALSPSPPIAVSEASGCIASTARDMGAYLSMLINRGAGPKGRVLSKAAFELFSTAYIAADEFGAGASYGYGIAVDTFDGHRRLRHTGGMLSFASALEIDLDSGVGVFASVNSMQGYRPRPVAEYALRLMRACRDGAPLPSMPPRNPPLHVASAADYAGHYIGRGGRALDIVAQGDRLYLEFEGSRVDLEPALEPADSFTVLHPKFAHYPLVFGRAGDNDKSPVVDAGWGEEWYAGPALRGPCEFNAPDEWRHFVGHYRNEDQWIGSHRIVLRQGRLWLDGTIPLELLPDGRFYLRDEPSNPEWISFSDIVNGCAMRMRLSGADLQRV